MEIKKHNDIRKRKPKSIKTKSIKANSSKRTSPHSTPRNNSSPNTSFSSQNNKDDSKVVKFIRDRIDVSGIIKSHTNIKT